MSKYNVDKGDNKNREYRIKQTAYGHNIIQIVGDNARALIQIINQYFTSPFPTNLIALLTTLLIIQILYYSFFLCLTPIAAEPGSVGLMGYCTALCLAPVCGAPAVYGLVVGVQQMSHNRKVARRLLWMGLATGLISALPYLPIFAILGIPRLVKALGLSDELIRLLEQIVPPTPVP